MTVGNDRDDFWDLDKLVPKKKQIRPFSAGVRCAEVTVDATGDDSSFAERRLNFMDMRKSDAAGVEDREYVPEGNSFIKRVSIKHSLDRYDFYGNFRKAALVYYEYKTSKCDYVPFYSYLPQYSQLSPEQKNYYFYWRDELRRHKYIKADYSYICLYAFEILNLPDKIPPKEGVKLLCEVWRNYRATSPRLDADFSVWVQDYCLVWELNAPIEYISDFLGEIISLSPLNEFYFSKEAAESRENRAMLLSSLSDYDWKKVKYATGETAALYAKHMTAAMSGVIFDMWYSGDIARSVNKTEIIRRPAFVKSICTHTVKCNLEIEYAPLALSALRDKITSATRYCENKLRALMGVKSRLTIKDMDGYYAHIIDKYFDAVYKTEGQKRKAELTPEYEKLYDAPRGELSFAGASEIEAGSWQTTARLVADEAPDEIIPMLGGIRESNETEPPLASKQENTETVKETDASAPIFATEKTNVAHDVSLAEQERINPRYGVQAEKQSRLSSEDTAFLLACLDFASPKSSLENDMTAERINEALYDEIGDIVIEAVDGGYNIVEDYREDIERLIQND